MKDSNAPGIPRVGCGAISVPMDEEFHRGMILPLATARNNFFDDVLVTVKMTKGSSSGGSADEGHDTISVKRDEHIVFLTVASGRNLRLWSSSSIGTNMARQLTLGIRGYRNLKPRANLREVLL